MTSIPPLTALRAYGCSRRVIDLFSQIDEPDVELARVVRVERSACRAAFDEGPQRSVEASPLPAVGDWIAVRHGELVEVLPRSSALTRADPDGSSTQVLAANVDLVLVVAPADRLSAERVERELAIAWDSGAVPIVVLTKSDLAEPGMVTDLVERLVGVDVLSISSIDGRGVDNLRRRLRPSATAVLLGPSGAGKSTLANLLLRADVLATGTVRDTDNRGRHTTTSRSLVPVPGGGVIIDTPGLRSLGLSAAVDVAAAFPDISAYAQQCRFADCIHEVEPGCAVIAALQRGDIDPLRLASFRKLQREMIDGAAELDPVVRRAQVSQSKSRSRAAKRKRR